MNDCSSPVLHGRLPPLGHNVGGYLRYDFNSRITNMNLPLHLHHYQYQSYTNIILNPKCTVFSRKRSSKYKEIYTNLFCDSFVKAKICIQYIKFESHYLLSFICIENCSIKRYRTRNGGPINVT